jgi:serine protease AprX
MRVHRVIATIIAAFIMSSPAQAAPLESDGQAPSAAPAPAGQAAVGQPLEVGRANGPALAAPRPAKGPSRLDADGNGLSDGLDERLATLGPNETIDVIVTFDGPGNAASARDAVGAFSVKHEYHLISGFAATMTGPQAQALARAPGVYRVQLDGTMYAYMETARPSFGVDDAFGMPAIPGGITGQGVVICVIDSGIWPRHEQFIAEFDPAAEGSETTKVEKFRDFVGAGISTGTEPGDQARDEHYHGTMVSAIAAGDGTEMSATLGGDPTLAWPLRGVAPGAKLWGAQVLEATADGGASGPDSGVVAGVEWCVDEWQADTAAGINRSLVINMSLGSPGLGCAGDPVAAAVDAAFAAGAAVIVASGNDGDGSDSQGTPACAAGAFSVAAAAEHAQPFTLPELSGTENYGTYIAPFSSRGSGMLGGATGPGITVASAFNTTTIIGFLGCTVEQPGCYAAGTGTSFASPFVAGIAALIREADPTLGPGEVYQILRDTAKPWGPGGTPNEVAGAGMVDGQAAVNAALNNGTIACVDYSPSPGPIYSIGTGNVANSGSVRFPIYVEDPGLPLAITLSIDGSVGPFGIWKPDLELQLLDANQVPYLIANPLYPWFSDDPFIPAPGTSSTCPAGEDCGLVGAQETLHLALPAAAGEDLTLPGPHYWIDVFPFDGFPNSGAGGTFTLELSNAYSDFGPDPAACILTANAGPDQTVTDSDGGGEVVVLDGSASIGAVSYVWTADTAVPIDPVVSPSATFPVGVHNITLEVSDGSGGVDSDIVVVTVNTPNTPPVADDQNVSTPEDTPVAVTLTGSDGDGEPLTFVVASGPANGSLSGAAPGLTYTPNLNYFGPDSFTFTANDGTEDSAPATVSITVNPVNDAPVADAKNVVTDVDTAVAITLTGSDVDDLSLTFTVASGPSNGSLSGTAPSLTYTPNPGYSGPDNLTYTASDGILVSDPAAVAITVNPANSAPVAVVQVLGAQPFVLSDTLVVNLSGAGSSDPDGDPITYAWTMLSKPRKSNSVLLDANTIAASFDPDRAGTYEIQLEVSDGLASSFDTATITIEKPPKGGGGGFCEDHPNHRKCTS